MIDCDEPITFRKFKKIVWNGTEWETVFFYEMKKSEKERREISDWLTEHYNRAVYTKTWWVTWDGVVMSEKVYVHWKLCE